METEVQAVRAQLFGLQDETYRDFQSALMPTVPKEKVIGVRTPALRKLAKQLAGIAAWKLGFERSSIWDVISTNIK